MDVNDKAPDFTLSDENGKMISLRDFRSKNVVLFFYPKANTPGWTIEASEFRDASQKLTRAGAVVLGISPDPPQAQLNFKKKLGLAYTLLCDTDKKVAEEYGVLKEKNMYGKTVMGIERTTFLIGPEGRVRQVFHKVKPEGHAEEVLTALKSAAAAD